MWTRRFGTLAATLAAVVLAAACGVASSQYRDSLTRHDRAVARRPKVLDDGRDLFSGAKTLGRAALVEAALARNPSIDHARAAWRAAVARYPQATSLDDPTLAYTLAPLSIASSEVDFGQVIEISQPLPYPGKRRLRGQVALAEAEAARQDYEAIKLRIALIATHLYYELYATERAIAINIEYEKELEEHRETLSAHLAAGHAWQDDALKVDVELGEVVQAGVDLDADRDIVVAQINELLHRSPELPLPRLPQTLEVPDAGERSTDELQSIAVKNRPELRAAGARRDRESASIELAERDFYPDFRVMGRYNSMWPQFEHEGMVGLAVTLPVWRGKRRGALDEARARREQASVAIALVEDRVRSEVERARRAYVAALDVVKIYRDDIVPSAKMRVESIRLGLDSSRVPYIEVLRADHDLLEVTLRYERALAAVYRRRGDLEAALGVIAGMGDDRGSR